MSREECLICKAPLEYLVRDKLMECAICHKKEPSKTRCVKGHYVCNECHTQGMDCIFGLCLAETSADPVVILRKMMDQPFCHMHGPEHHVMVGAALLTAYKTPEAGWSWKKLFMKCTAGAKRSPAGRAASGEPVERGSAPDNFWLLLPIPLPWPGSPGA